MFLDSLIYKHCHTGCSSDYQYLFATLSILMEPSGNKSPTYKV